jgi:hypothetical protein
MEILDNDENTEIITWLPHGRGFVILRKKAFEQSILPKYFHKQSKYSSFTRKLNRWGFVRVTRGAEAGAYYHQFFRRDGHALVMQMSCSSNAKGAATTIQASPLVEPMSSGLFQLGMNAAPAPGNQLLQLQLHQQLIQQELMRRALANQQQQFQVQAPQLNNNTAASLRMLLNSAQYNPSSLLNRNRFS